MEPQSASLDMPVAGPASDSSHASHAFRYDTVRLGARPGKDASH